MAYEKQTWVDGDKTKPLSAARLNHIEDGIASIPAGKNGKSAYEIALDDGFVGTESAWLTSLKGTNGKNGTDGKDAEPQFTDEEVAELKKLLSPVGE